ncbi:MAG TPA: MarR family transcriptional regulator [Acidobacteriaceae bacterium]|nr:MarR family transcriptional regulator [Acidobacteriaceae bacterium]
MARTTDLLSRGPAQLLKEADLSPAQYNVLRILRGSPDGLLCGQIAERMITRDPDITRLLDRMEKRDLLRRHRDAADRRRVLVRISQQGLAALSRLDEPMQQIHIRQLGHLAPKRLQKLLRELQACRFPDK